MGTSTVRRHKTTEQSMPTPYQLEPGGSFVMSTQGLRHRPHHAFMIGLIAAEWSNLERELVYMFSMLMGTQQITAFGQVSYTGNPLAEIALGEIYGMKPRLRLIKTALAARLGEDEQAELRDCLDGINRVGERRNEAVHGKWAVDPAKPDHVVLISKKGLLAYSVEDFDEVLVEISNATWRFLSFMNDWLEKRRKELVASG